MRNHDEQLLIRVREWKTRAISFGDLKSAIIAWCDETLGVVPVQPTASRHTASFRTGQDLVDLASTIAGIVNDGTREGEAIRDCFRDVATDYAIHQLEPLSPSEGAKVWESHGTTRSNETFASGRYIVFEPPVVSGESEVWKVQDVRTSKPLDGIQVESDRPTTVGRFVAMKRPKRVALRSVRLFRLAATRLLAEGRRAAMLEHPNICPVYDVFEGNEEEAPYYTMRFLEDATLEDAICSVHKSVGNGKVMIDDWKKVVGHLNDAASGVAYAHRQGFAHLDLKPRNIAVTPENGTLVLDWGMASRLEAGIVSARDSSPLCDDDLTIPQTSQSNWGTPAYASPEQWQRLACSPRTDIYQLGAVLFEIMTGRPPLGFHSSDFTHLCGVLGVIPDLERLIASKFRGNRRLAQLASICQKAMQPDPTRRYPSIANFQQDLRRWLADEPVSTFPETVSSHVGRYWRKFRPAIIAAGLILGIPLGGVSLLWYSAWNEQLNAKAAAEVATTNAIDAERRENAANQRATQANKDELLAKQGLEKALVGVADAEKRELESTSRANLAIRKLQEADDKLRLTTNAATLTSSALNMRLGQVDAARNELQKIDSPEVRNSFLARAIDEAVSVDSPTIEANTSYEGLSALACWTDDRIVRVFYANGRLIDWRRDEGQWRILASNWIEGDGGLFDFVSLFDSNGKLIVTQVDDAFRAESDTSMPLQQGDEIVAASKDDLEWVDGNIANQASLAKISSGEIGGAVRLRVRRRGVDEINRTHEVMTWRVLGKLRIMDTAQVPLKQFARFSPDGQTLGIVQPVAADGTKARIVLFDTRQGRRTKCPPIELAPLDRFSVESVSLNFSGDSRRLVVSPRKDPQFNGQLGYAVLEVDSGELLKSIVWAAGGNSVPALSWRGDSIFVDAILNDGGLIRWPVTDRMVGAVSDISDGRQVVSGKREVSLAMATGCSGDDRFHLSAGIGNRERIAVVRDLRSGAVISKTSIDGNPLVVKFSPTNRAAAVATETGNFYVFGVETGVKPVVANIANRSIYDIAIKSDTSDLMVATSAGTRQITYVRFREVVNDAGLIARNWSDNDVTHTGTLPAHKISRWTAANVLHRAVSNLTNGTCQLTRTVISPEGSPQVQMLWNDPRSEPPASFGFPFLSPDGQRMVVARRETDDEETLLTWNPQRPDLPPSQHKVGKDEILGLAFVGEHGLLLKRRPRIGDHPLTEGVGLRVEYWDGLNENSQPQIHRDPEESFWFGIRGGAGDFWLKHARKLECRDPKSWRLTRSILLPDKDIQSSQISTDGAMFAALARTEGSTTTEDGYRLMLLDLRDPDRTPAYADGVTIAQGWAVPAFAATKPWVAIGDGRGQVVIWDYQKHQIVAKRSLKDDGVLDKNASPVATPHVIRLIFAPDDTTISIVWRDYDTPMSPRAFREAKFSPRCSGAVLWDFVNGRDPAVIPGDFGVNGNFKISAPTLGRDLIVSISNDESTARVWKLPNWTMSHKVSFPQPEKPERYPAPVALIDEIAATPDGRRLAVGGQKKNSQDTCVVAIVDAESGEVFGRAETKLSHIDSIVFDGPTTIHVSGCRIVSDKQGKHFRLLSQTFELGSQAGKIQVSPVKERDHGAANLAVSSHLKQGLFGVSSNYRTADPDGHRSRFVWADGRLLLAYFNDDGDEWRQKNITLNRPRIEWVDARTGNQVGTSPAVLPALNDNNKSEATCFVMNYKLVSDGQRILMAYQPALAGGHDAHVAWPWACSLHEFDRDPVALTPPLAPQPTIRSTELTDERHFSPSLALNLINQTITISNGSSISFRLSKLPQVNIGSVRVEGGTFHPRLCFSPNGKWLLIETAGTAFGLVAKDAAGVDTRQ